MQDRDYAFWFKSNAGWMLIVLFCAIPVLYLSHLHSFSESFSSSTQTFLTLGKFTAFVGFILYAINIILTLRMRWLEGLFNGLNRVYIAHHLTGGIALSCLVFNNHFIEQR